MTDHICNEWRFNTKRKGDNWFCCTECEKVIHAGEIERRLNEYEKIKKATQVLSAGDVREMARYQNHPEYSKEHELMLKVYADILDGKQEC